MMLSSILKAMNKMILCPPSFTYLKRWLEGEKKKQPKQSTNIDNTFKKYGDLTEQVLVQKLSAISLKLTDMIPFPNSFMQMSMHPHET